MGLTKLLAIASQWKHPNKIEAMSGGIWLNGA